MDDPTPRPLRRETKCTCEAPVPSGGLVLLRSTPSQHTFVAQPFLPALSCEGAVWFSPVNFSQPDRIRQVLVRPSSLDLVKHYSGSRYNYKNHIEPRPFPPYRFESHF